MTAQHIGRVAEWLLLAACSALLFAHTLPKAWRTLNTDFPNYYLAAQLAHEGYDTSQVYDWRWLQREKDHRAIDQRIIGLAPITPFSTLFVWPLTRLAPLQAKHLWLLVQLTLLIPIGFGIRELTGQPLRRIALIGAACFPLHRNLLYGQFYLLLLAMLVMACWAYRERLPVLCGAAVAIATMTKIFPAVFLLYLLRKRDWRALSAAAVTLVLCGSLSLWVFGWGLHRHYLQVVLPWTLRGETMPPYVLASSSIATLLHRLLVYEPQWNPHPWHSAPMLAAVLAPLLQMLVIAPVFLIMRAQNDRRLVPLEWSALLCATLAISTVPASYNFTLLVLPLAVLCSELLERRPAVAMLGTLLFLGIGYPSWNASDVDGLRAVLHEPRLVLVLGVSLLCLWTMAQATDCPRLLHAGDVRWGVALAAVAVLGVVAAVRHQRGLYADYPFRVPMQSSILFSADPINNGDGIEAISLLPEGYRLTHGGSETLRPGINDQTDTLSFASSKGGGWAEDVTTTSRIHAPAQALVLEDAHSPKLSAAGQLLAYQRDRMGRSQLVASTGVPLTPANWNVLDAAPLPDGGFVVAASEGREAPALYRVESDGQTRRPMQPLRLGEARYPAPSPDGRWLAYSRYESGSWNLWLLDRSANTVRPLTEGSCNRVESSWEADSKTLLYASDCGRALGFTAICRRRVIPE